MGIRTPTAPVRVVTARAAPRQLRNESDLGRTLMALEVECAQHREEEGHVVPCPYEGPNFSLLDPQGIEPDGWDTDKRPARPGVVHPTHLFLLLVRGSFDRPHSRACAHCLKAAHSVSLDDWRDALTLFDPVGMAEKPLDDEGGAVVIKEKDRWAVYSDRVERSVAIFHPDDVLHDDRVGRLGTAGRRDVRARDDGLVAEGRGDEVPVEKRWEMGQPVPVADMHRLVLAEMAAREAVRSRVRAEREAEGTGDGGR